MTALRDILQSEKGLTALSLIVGATVLAALELMTIREWMTYTGAIYAAYSTGTGLRAIGVGIAKRKDENRASTGEATES
jgi:hypothetical protein